MDHGMPFHTRTRYETYETETKGFPAVEAPI